VTVWRYQGQKDKNGEEIKGKKMANEQIREEESVE